MQEVAKEERLALLLQSDHRVKLGLGAHRYHAVQELHVRGRHFHVDQKIRAVGREQQCDIVGIDEQRVEVESPLVVVLDRDHERPEMVAVDDAADDVRGPVAKEE